ncbi:magnesium chelatase [Alicyclobacillus acidoterrestris]|uniref:AAA family ATPase n=1 Tax=Alicyclobacillus suci TaxID=2816080 RepID=UPI001196F3F1|nr:MoxR family ATPase [Alicyclobacillus suci]GEO24264.1 magnesium chelatase [Alicyclobacillus acidoterrestris]
MSESVITSTQSKIPEIIEQLAKKIVGHRDTLELVTAACLAGGHVLLQDVPGTGKTRLAASLASVFGLAFRRVQGTPDLLPADVVGATVFHPQDNQFTFHQGPIFTNVLLMDEINRATPRTQSALLEAMAEKQVSADGVTYPLPNPFFVIATANPLESQGVFPLPEAQLDRFLVQLNLGYTSAEDEFEMVRRVIFTDDAPLTQVLSQTDVILAQQEVRQIRVSDDILHYIVRLCRATRNHDQVELGASPRSIVALTQYAQSLAYLSQRSFVTPDDVKRAFYPTMTHRLQLNIGWMGEGGAQRVLDDVIQGVPLPNERAEV